MARQTPDRDLAKSQANLLNGYREALRRADSLDTIDGALVRHVVAISADAARSRLITHTGAKQLAEEAGVFADEVRKLDSLGKTLNFAGALAQEKSQAVLALLVSGAVIAVPLEFLDSMGAFGRDVGQQSGLKPYILNLLRLAIVGGGAKFVSDYGDAVREVWSGPVAGRSVLFQTVDSPEREFFRRLGREPPARPAGHVLGPLAAVAIVALTAVAGWFILNVIIGAL